MTFKNSALKKLQLLLYVDVRESVGSLINDSDVGRQMMAAGR